MGKKGITPVIAIVLLLMITVAAAGATYVWIQKILSSQQKEINTKLETKLQILQTTCHAGTNKLELIIINSGKRTVDMSPLDVIVYDSSGSVTPITKINVDESSMSNATAWKQAQKPGGYTGPVTLTLNGKFVAGEYYSKITLRFKNSDYSIDTDCMAK